MWNNAKPWNDFGQWFNGTRRWNEDEHVNTLKFLPVKSGTVTLGSGATSNTATISAVTLTKSLLRYTYNSTATVDDADENAVTGNITNATTLTFQRNGTNASIISIQWYLIEWMPSCPVTVQRGMTNSGSSQAQPVNQVISPVILANTFVMSTVRVNSGNYSSNCVVTAELTSTTNIAFEATSTNTSDVENEWQVVQNLDWTVQSVSTSLGVAGNTNLTLGTPIPLANSFLCCTVRSLALYGSNRAYQYSQTTTTNVNLRSNSGTGSRYAVLYAVDTHGDFIATHTGYLTFDDTALTDDFAITGNTATNSFISSGSTLISFGSLSSTDIGRDGCLSLAYNGSNIRATRTNGTSGSTPSWTATSHRINGLA